jgi:hypothetical protein
VSLENLDVFSNLIFLTNTDKATKQSGTNLAVQEYGIFLIPYPHEWKVIESAVVASLRENFFIPSIRFEFLAWGFEASVF